jgi:hypothetical protein
VLRGRLSPGPKTARMARFVIAVITALAVGLVAVAALPAQAEPDSYECLGAPPDYPNRFYPEPRVFLESQDWWSAGRMAPGGASTHIHLGACFPQGTAWKPDAEGKVRLDFRIMLHNVANYQVARFRGSIACCDPIPGGGAGFDDTSRETKDLIASAMPNGYVHITKFLDLHGAGTDGRKEARFTVDLRHGRNERRSFQSSGWQSYVDNPEITVTSDYRSKDSVAARGWYAGFGYTNATYGDFYCSAAPPSVSGLWQPKASMAPGSGGVRVTSYSAHVDPDFHAGSAGWIVARGRGSFEGHLSIDTTQLTNGPHRLVLVANARKLSRHDRIANGTSSGVQVIPFVVAN